VLCSAGLYSGTRAGMLLSYLSYQTKVTSAYPHRLFLFLSFFLQFRNYKGFVLMLEALFPVVSCFFELFSYRSSLNIIDRNTSLMKRLTKMIYVYQEELVAT
jgi:hypothetical protein